MKNATTIRIADLTDTQKAVLFDQLAAEGVITEKVASEAAVNLAVEAADAIDRLARIGHIVDHVVDKAQDVVHVPPMPKLPARASRKKRVRKVPKATSAKRDRTSVKPAIAPAQVASRKLQGKYLALVRQFPKAERARWAAGVKAHGRRVAIQLMRDELDARKANSIEG